EKLEGLLEEYEKQLLDKEQQKEQEELEIEYIKPELKAKIEKDIRKHIEEQLILLKDNKQNIIDFIIDNKDSIKVEDMRIYGSVYKCYRKKGHCHIVIH
ncbi:MAG TPA: hypothetical protein VJ697_04560, partial [Nitrososphaeraceae archaeon]|nr:hypothetical protein [Nitrososphaeraceae archaeon]